MLHHGVFELIKIFRNFLFICLLLFPLKLYASFIEATIGTAVVNDATATYFNPAALTLLKNSQIIGLGTIADFRTHFTGQAIQSGTGFIQSGSTSSRTHYYLPSFYMGIPVANKVTFGLAVVSNIFNRDIEANSILRYVQSSNRIQDIDLVPAVGIKFNEYFSVGAGITVSYANFVLQPISGYQNLNIPDNQSRNESSGTSWGGNVGFLLKPANSTVIGFNYRSAITYRLNGRSVFEGTPNVISNNYGLTFWTPARSVFSINHFVTPKLGFIGTIQRIQWSIFKNVPIHGIATQIGSRSVILPQVNVPYYLHNAWILTLGTHYRITPKWVVRLAGTYNQSPSNGNYQISNGDSITAGMSMGYEINKNIIIDGSYAHTFIQNQNVHITTGSNLVTGINGGFQNAVSLKLTFNLV